MTTIQGQISNRGERPIRNIAERVSDGNEAIKRNNEALSNNIRVCMPAIVVSFNAAKQTISAQPAIREKRIDTATGAADWVTLPVLEDVPVQYPKGGGCGFTFPLAPGDEVMLVFADLCIDSWFTFGGIQNWNDRRRHNLSDAFAIPGVSSQPNVIEGFNSTAAEIRTLDGTSKVSVGVDGVTVTTPVLNIAAGVVNIMTGGVAITGEEVGNADLTINGQDYFNHRHTGVQNGPSNTGPVDL